MGNSQSSTLKERYTLGQVKDLFARKMGTTAGIKSYRALNYSTKKDRDYAKFADMCVARQVDPRCVIDWGFSAYYPNIPISIKLLYPAVAEYADFNLKSQQKSGVAVDLEYDRVSILFKNMLNRLKEQKDSKKLAKALLDPVNEFSYVFVFCVSSSLGILDQIPTRVVEVAKEEIFLRPVYKCRFSHLLPKEVTL